MAINDWNHDGKKDMVDNYIEYQIYKDVTGVAISNTFLQLLYFFCEGGGEQSGL